MAAVEDGETTQSSAMQVHVSPLKCFAIRLRPGQEIMKEMRAAVEMAHFRAAFVMTCVGSCTSATIRLATATVEKPNEVCASRQLSILSTLFQACTVNYI